MEAFLKKMQYGLVPDNPATNEWYEKLKFGDVVRCKASKARVGWRHKKFFALLNIAFEAWEPAEICSKYGVPQKNFNQFRKDVTILSGYYELYNRLDGTFRV